ncbi:unnamed protein product, partial [Meganyctiphanes norvegica]
CCVPKSCAEDSSCTANGGTCVKSEEACKPGHIVGNCAKGCKCCIPKGQCAIKDEFACSNNKCVDAAYQCDKDNDCKDNSDEEGCNFADNLSCYWCKTWESNGGATFDESCKDQNYAGITELMEPSDPYVGCAVKVY